MVAAAISQSDLKASTLILRETTLMPDIRGFGPLMALLFSPTMELKRDKGKYRYTSILTGLGYDPEKKRPIYDEHDMIMHLDVVITTEDIEKVHSQLGQKLIENKFSHNRYFIRIFRSINCVTALIHCFILAKARSYRIMLVKPTRTRSRSKLKS